ncbi:MAG: nuclear transport factor 2 family protein [Candidatus Cryosericum sp.]
MKRTVLLVLVAMISFSLVSCRQQETSETETQKRISEALSLAQQYSSAYETKSAEKYLALFSDDGKYTDYGNPGFGTWNIKLLEHEVYGTFARKEVEVKFSSLFASSDGQFAALEGVYTDIGKDGTVSSAPFVSILEFKDGKIIHETLSYDGREFN